MMQFTRRRFVTGAVTAGVLSAAARPVFPSETSPAFDSKPKADWMIDPSAYAAEVIRTPDGHGIALTNGLVRRAFCLGPNVATIAFDNLVTGESILRSIRPEATLTIDNFELSVGGLVGQPIQHYLLPEWLDQMTADRVHSVLIVWKKESLWSAFRGGGFQPGPRKNSLGLPWKGSYFPL